MTSTLKQELSSLTSKILTKGNMFIHILIALIIVLAAIGRFLAYDDPHLAVATTDTVSYVNSSEAGLLSKEFFSGQRLPTTNLIYKILRPANGYVDFVVPNTTERQILAGYEDIALLQVILSILGWGGLAYTISSRVKNALLKLAACAIILLVGFVPQTADWDSVMGSESLSYSLFAIAFALLVLLVFRIHEERSAATGTRIIGAAFCLTFMLWAYTRDSNNLSAVITAALCGGALLIKGYQGLRILRAMTVFITLSTLVGIISSMGSSRSVTPMRNVFDVHVLPFASRVEFMQSLGMPEPFTPGYYAWADEHAANAYLAFMITHPRYTIIRYVQGAQDAFVDYIQPYFRTPGNEWRENLLAVGQIINVGFVAFFVDILLILTFWGLLFRGGWDPARPWIWLATWLFLTAAATLFFGIMGDNIGIYRHTLLPIAAFRLFFWIFLIVAMDLLLLRRDEAVAATGER